MNELNNSSIYQIKNIVNNKIYVGSAVNTRKRWAKHRHDLRKGIHKSNYLQNSWNKYGESNFSFEIIEYVKDKEKLIEREQYWLDFYKSYERKYGYNVCKVSKSSLGIKRTDEYKEKLSKAHKGKKLSKEHIENIIKSRKENGTFGISNKGYKFTTEQRQKISNTSIKNGSTKGSNNAMAILDEEIVREIILDLISGLKNKEISLKYSISKGLVSAINNKNIWKHVIIEGYEDVEIYNKVKKKRLRFDKSEVSYN